MNNFVCCYESSCSNFDDCGFGYDNQCDYRCDECKNINHPSECQNCDHRDYNLGFCNSED